MTARSHHHLGFQSREAQRAAAQRAHDAWVEELETHGVPIAPGDEPLVGRVLAAQGHAYDVRDGLLFTTWEGVAAVRGAFSSYARDAQRYAAYTGLPADDVLAAIVHHLPGAITMTQHGAPWITRGQPGIELRVDDEVLLIDGQPVLAQAA